MKHSRVFGSLTGLFVFFFHIASAQVATGVQPYGSFGGGPFDTVNLGNLNVHFSIPVLHKAGRGLPFSYDLGYDSSIWYPVTTNGHTTWTPTLNWGWMSQSPAMIGYLKTATTSQTQSMKCSGGFGGITTNTTTYTYFDNNGRSHPFPGSTLVYSYAGGCSGPTYGPPLTALTTDGSGFTLYAPANQVGATVTTLSGVIVATNVVGRGNAGQYQDDNGNLLTVNSSGQYFDTLSSSTAVLTQAGSGTPTSPLTYTYTAPSGASAVYTVNFTQYTVATNFGIAGISDYGAQSNALISSIVLPDDTQSIPDRFTFSYEQTPGSCTPLPNTWQGNCITGRIASVTLPTGGTITYTYSGGSNGIYSDGSTAGLKRILAASTVCNPTNGCWQYSRNLVSGTAGPGSTWQTTVIDPNSNYTVLNLAEDGSTNTSTTVATYDFYETQRQAYQGSVSSSNLLATLIKCYNSNYASCSTATVKSPISQMDVYGQLPNGSTRLSETVYNGFGLVTDNKEYDYGVSLGSAPGNSHLVRETSTSYASLGNNIVDRPASVTVSDWSTGTQTTLAYSTYGYDGGTPISTTSPQHISITGSRGNLTSSSLYTGSNYLIRQFTYYDTGMLNNTTSPDLSTSTTCANKPTICTTYNYSSASCGNSFVTSISEPLSLSRSITWSCSGGLVTQTTDENSNSVSTNYTNAYFWRPDNTYDQANNETTINYFGPTVVESSLVNFNGGQSAVDLRATVDAYGRSILSQRLQGPNVSTYDTSETDYNNVGLPYQTTMPFAAPASTTSSTAPRTTTNYDALGRPTSITDANGGTVSYTYTNNDVLQTVSGTQTFQKQFEYDGLGRLTSVCEMSQATGSGNCNQSNQVSGFWTKYTYDALGHLLTVKQNAQAATGGQQNRTYVYDEQGRMTSESNPETGIINYTFDRADSTCGGYVSAGDLVEKKDAIGNVTCFQYDTLHRLTQTTYAAGTYASNTPTKCFVYDAATVNGNSMANAKTRLAEAYTTTASSCPGTPKVDEGFSYSVRGETSDVWESTPHSTVYYHINATYWAHGALNQLSGIPSVPTLYYGYNGTSGPGLDGEGRYTRVASQTGTDPVPYGDVTYNNSGTSEPIGALTQVTYGSGDNDTFQYDTNTGRITQYQFNMGTGPQSQTGKLQWNTNGTLAQLQIIDQINSSNSQTCNFAYDDLARIDSANCGAWSQTFGFDPFGNLSKSGSAQFLPTYTGTNQAPGTSPTNQYYQLSGGGPGVSNYYDNNGNLTSDYVSGTGHTYAWDADGNMIAVDTTLANCGSSGICLTYDALDRIVEQTPSSGHTEVLYGVNGAKLALMNGQVLVNAFIALPGGGMAVYNSSGIAYYRHSDHFGSSRLATTPSRTKYNDVAYAPYGEDYNGSGTVDLSFTAQNQDTVTGGWSTNLYDFLMREYRTGQGRWTSPDPAGMAAVDPSSPQTWNRYAYVGNNPMSYIDPYGLQQAGPGKCQAGAGDPCGPTVLFGYALWGFYYSNGERMGIISWLLDWQGHNNSSGDASNGGMSCLAGYGPLAVGQSRCKNPCPPVHLPAGQNISDNIATVQNSPGQAAFFNPDVAGLIRLQTWYQNICCWNSAWNYQKGGQQYDDAGNQNYGATGTALGFSPSTLLVAAGLKKTFIDYGLKFELNPYLSNPYMNAPAKTNAIQQGIQYANNGCTN